MQHKVERSVLKLMRGPGWMDGIMNLCQHHGKQMFFFQDVLLQLSAEIRAFLTAELKLKLCTHTLSLNILFVKSFSAEVLLKILPCVFLKVSERNKVTSVLQTITLDKRYI